MSNRKSRARANRMQKVVAILVMLSMVLGGATFLIAGNSVQTQNLPVTQQSL
jgi:hypothetical protein